jgi:hypothetical protein
MNKHILFTENNKLPFINTFKMDLRRDPKVNDICLLINKENDLETEATIIGVDLYLEDNRFKVITVNTTY